MTNVARTEYSGAELEALSLAVNYHRWIVDEFKPFLGEAVVEVGAGIGSVSKLLLETDIKRLFAFEPSTDEYLKLSEVVQTEPRAVAIHGRFSDRHAPEGAHSVVYVNVLEHIDDDRAELKHAFDALQSNGHLLVFVPALRWLYSNFDRQVGHRRRYSKPQLCQLVSDVGFSVVKARYFDVAGIIPWYISFVVLRGQPKGGTVWLYDRLIVPPMRLMEGVLPPPVGKDVLLIARKP